MLLPIYDKQIIKRESAKRMIFNPIVHVRKTIITLLLIILWPVLVYGGTIFSDNFDSCTVNCNATTISPPNSAGWSQWATGYVSDTIGGVQHYSGEITSPGRGGSGKSLKMWRAAGVFGDYTGALYLTDFGSHNHIFMRYWIKIPTAFDFTGTGTGFKSWRLKTNSEKPGYNEIYLNFYGGNNSSLRNGGGQWAIYDGSGWTTILSNSALRNIWDGNWHSVEWEIGITSNILRLWIDDVLKYQDTNRAWHLTGDLSGMQHFNIGNTFNHEGTWQTGWQAMELDDFVLSTTYVGPVSGGAAPPPLTKQPNPPGNIQFR